jgi:hypothetical protein
VADGEDIDAGQVRAPVSYLIAETVAFLAELMLLATLGVVGWRLGTGGLSSIALAALYPALAALIWAVWIAPRAAHRLADPWRLGAQIALFLVAGVLAVITDLTVWGVVVAAVGIAAFVATHVFARPR